jgi:CBS domain containing-hemolysin-like protein
MSLSIKGLHLISCLIMTFGCVGSAVAGGAEETSTSIIENTSADVVLLITYVLLALGISFLCSVAEAVLLSVTPSYIEGLKERRPRFAAKLKRLKQDNVEQSLAAILTLNTIANTLGAIGAGAKATVVFGSVWFGLFSAVMTLMILFLSEIVPKTIGALYWSRLVRPIAFFVNSMIIILYPIVRIAEIVTRVVSRGKPVHIFSREEFIAMARVGERIGYIHDNESRIIRNLFRFSSLTIADIMTPRTVISAISEDMTISEAFNLVSKSPFSRLPLYRNNMDDITGFILKEDVLIFNAQGRDDEKVKVLKRDIIVVSELMSLPILLENFLEYRQHIAVVVDEYGGTSGLVTLEDLVETLMGMEITDEKDTVVDMQKLARRRWAERAKALGIESEETKEGEIKE